MSAVFWVRFDNGSLLSVSSADARSMKRADLREATRKAAAKARERIKRTLRKGEPRPKVVEVRCVG